MTRIGFIVLAMLLSAVGHAQVKTSEMMGLGWNLGNQFDASRNGVANETAWGNAATTQALFDKLAQAGVRSVRIPVTWTGRMGDAPGYTIDPSWLARIREVVGFAEKAGLTVIINSHHDGSWLNVKRAADDEAVKRATEARFVALWRQVATAFRDKGDFLIFEPFNELHDGRWGKGTNRTDGGRQYAVINEWNQLFVNTVRATGGKNAKRWLAVVGYVANGELTADHLVMPRDKAKNRLMVGFHFYSPTDYTLTAKFSEWGHTAAAGKKESWGDEDNVAKELTRMKEAFIDKGIPVYIGEMGCVNRADERQTAFRKYYLEYVAKTARDLGMGIFLWDNGSRRFGHECHGYFDHATGEFVNDGAEMMEVLKRPYVNTAPSYTLKSVYDSAPDNAR